MAEEGRIRASLEEGFRCARHLEFEDFLDVVTERSERRMVILCEVNLRWQIVGNH